MKIYVIKDSVNNTYYTGKSRPSGKIKIPHFSEKIDNGKIYRKLSHARSARTNMKTYTKMTGIDILEFDAEFSGYR